MLAFRLHEVFIDTLLAPFESGALQSHGQSVTSSFLLMGTILR